ncbi:hypothetical protein SAMN04488134_101664 [Amphibacillus marinus]|uniref:Uncharacterized protein n=1 Tax=Amphibacillus marinus TaxID=872970 RepID=A0A1H8IP81_9BACI|nr:hypothetical protein [Amphibacillus marinus]SEN69796.1 hypothetical protein SAMN04488134_101664 [Amphibacillus marinus]
MSKTKQNWRLMHGLMISFYLLGLLAFVVIGDLSAPVNRVLFTVFLIIIIQEIFKYVQRLRRDLNKL